MTRWTQPARMASWLAARVSTAASLECLQVEFRPTGVLRFVYRQSTGTASVLLHVGRRGRTGLRCRLGTLVLPSRTEAKASRTLLKRTAAALHSVFPREPPAWLLLRNRELTEIPWSGQFVDSLCKELIEPGATRWFDTRLERLSFREDTLSFHFSGSTEFTAMLQPTSEADDPRIVGRYGPLALTVTDQASLGHPLVRYLSYVLALSVPAGASLQRALRPQGREESRLGDPIGDESFLVETFLDEIEMVRALFAARGRIFTIANMDRECPACFKAAGGYTAQADLDFWGIRPGTWFEDSLRLSDLGDLDVVAEGGEPVVERLVRAACQDPSCELIVTMNSCVGNLIGDDVRRIPPRLVGANDRRVPIIAFDVCLDEPENYAQLWDDLLDRFTPPSSTPSPGRVVLVGFGREEDRSVRELADLLQRFGVGEVLCLLPTFDIARLPDVADAAVTVLHPARHVTDGFRYAARHCRGRLLSPPAPWGARATLDWVSAVLDAMGLPTPSEHARGRLLAELLPPNWQPLRAVAAQNSVCLVASKRYLEQRDAPMRHGLPLPAFLEEMGFAMELVVCPASEETKGAVLSKEVLERWYPSGTSSARGPFLAASDDHSLTDVLASTGCRLLYSEYGVDGRALDAGLLPFSITDMEMGIAGMARTLDRLTTLSRVRFYSRYRAYLEKGTRP